MRARVTLETRASPRWTRRSGASHFPRRDAIPIDVLGIRELRDYGRDGGATLPGDAEREKKKRRQEGDPRPSCILHEGHGFVNTVVAIENCSWKIRFE